MMFIRAILALSLSAFVFALPVAHPQVVEIGGPNGGASCSTQYALLQALLI